MKAGATALERQATGDALREPDIATFIADSVRQAADPEALLILSVPAPVVSPEALLRAMSGQPASLWNPPDEPSFAAVGCVARIDVRGPQRLEQLRARAQRLWPRILTRSFACNPPPPRLFGGLAFRAGGAHERPWSDYGDGSFLLPRWCYGCDPGQQQAWLTVAVTEPPAHDPSALAASVATVLAALERDTGAPKISSTTVRMRQQPIEPWSVEVEAIRAAISRGECEKIVLARRATIDLSAPAEPTAVLERLAQCYPACFRFGFRRGLSSFVGATPERLVSKRGNRISTEALAGSIAVGANPSTETVAERAQALLASAKDRAEHELVVRAIAEALAPLCIDLSVPPTPGICTLRHVLHLRTPIAGVLRSDAHVLELVDALHPTPAVGGVPTERAMQWISEREPEDRGWYAGPVGWFDASGDGEFAVALRAGILRGRRAYIYAGAGIVADSDAKAEYAETELKQRALLGALGVAG